jgi:hypothetical protein
MENEANKTKPPKFKRIVAVIKKALPSCEIEGLCIEIAV